MIVVLFLTGLLACIGCGYNVICADGDWRHEFAWVLGGGIGASMMIGAIWLRHLGV